MDINKQAAIEILEAMGFTVSLSKPMFKKTFEIRTDLFERFIEVQKRRDIKIKEAINDALEQYIERWE